MVRYDGAYAGNDSGRYRTRVVTQRLPMTVSVRGSRSWWSWWRLDCRFPHLNSWILMFFWLAKGQSKWKKCWMHDQGLRKQSSRLFHIHGKLGNIPTLAAINWNGLLNMRHCLLLLLLLTFGCFLIMYPCSNSNASKRPRSKASGDR